jgi:hypothetical protein
MLRLALFALAATCLAGWAAAFAPLLAPGSPSVCPAQARSRAGASARGAVGALRAANDEDDALTKMMRASRKAGPNDRVVELRKPLGLVLEEDPIGDVYITKIKENSSADKKRDKIFEGDRIAFISATFGDDLWSVRKAGLGRVQKAVKVRQGDFVTLVLETTQESKKKAAQAQKERKARLGTAEQQQAKRDKLMAELQKDTEKKSKKFFGLF